MAEIDSSAESADWRDRFGASKTGTLLANTGFRRLYLARTVSGVGDELYFIAAMWLVYQLTGSTLYTGVAGFLSRLPQIVGFLFGPLVDRSRLSRLLVLVAAAQGVVVLAVPFASHVGAMSVPLVLTVVALLSLLGRVNAPAEKAALPRLVDDELLPRANSLDSSTQQTLGALAQAFSGALIAALGAVALFVFDAMTFAVGGLFFLLLSVPATEKTGTSPSAGEYAADIREGFDLIRGSVVGHMAVAAGIATAFTGMSASVLPAFADTFGGAETYGLLIAASTVGLLLGSLVASRFESVRFGRVTIVGFLVATVGRVAAVSTGWFPAVLLVYGVAAVPLGIYNVLVSATIQTGVPNDLLARVSSTIGSLIAVVGPVGYLLGGYLGDVVGSPVVIGLSGLGYCLLAVYWSAVPSLRGFPPVTDVEPNSFGA
ncbi:MFS transporter [Haladaptatus sp. DYF46]|uniref:MFS transporter n=1 Tax=Haladaptatus sp. DYF46 TaxID=2886041 RepID=UPI001E2FEB12|nr:MFS transporter [Haladaptatus sp. DYF46]